jgi:hypothetical protein
MKGLVDELLELSDPETDKKIIKSFELKDHLCPEIFDGKDMKKEVIDTLLEISDAFIEFTGIDLFIHDIVLTGSLANYNWSEYSDVDLHILIDMDDINDDDKTNSIALHDIVKEFFDSKKQLWNNTHDVNVKGFEVEIYVQDVDEPHVSSGVYSVLNNEWSVEPSMKKEDIDEKQILEKGEYFAKMIDSVIDNANSGKDETKAINDLRDKIKKFRQSGLEKGGEYSYENLTFKLLRRNGYIKKLIDLKNSVLDKKLSLT